MNTRSVVRCLCLAMILTVPSVTGCAGKKTHLNAAAVATPSGIRVSPAAVFSNGSVLVVKLNVINQARGPIVVDKAATRLTLADGRVLSPSSRAEEPKTMGPGATEMVRIDFRSSGFKWKEVTRALLDLSGTVVVGGAPSPMPPMELALGDLSGAPLAEVENKQIVINDQIQFRTASAEILADSDPIVDAVAQVLVTSPQITRLRVEGHTDATGPSSVNRELSNRRAAAVVAALVARGVRRDRLRSIGLGDTQPLDSNATDDGRQRNRRVEFHIEN
jgi:outer membrane protein OmpA-like peptidoglycan-associated protein